MDLVLTVVFIVCMLLWLLSALPFPQTAPFSWAHPLLAWICVLCLGLIIITGHGVVVR